MSIKVIDCLDDWWLIYDFVYKTQSKKIKFFSGETVFL